MYITGSSCNFTHFTVLLAFQHGRFGYLPISTSLNARQPAPYNGPYFPAISYEDNM